MKILLLSDNLTATSPLVEQIQQIDEQHHVTIATWPRYEPAVLEDVDFVILYVKSRALDTRDAQGALVRLRQRTRYPILLISSIERDALLVHLYACGVDDHLVPPVSEALMAAKLRVWRRWVGRLSSVLHH